MRSRGVPAVVILIGFTASIAQVVLMRELMVVFAGNELSLGMMLGSWLFWTASGSAAAGRFAPPSTDPRRFMAAVQILAAAALPLTILAVREGKSLLQSAPGESLGPGVMLLGSLAALGLFCVFSGALFAAASRLYSGSLARATGSVYLLEAAGSAAGGILAGLVLVQHLDSLQIAAGLSLLNLAAAASLAIGGRWIRRAALAALLLAAAWLLPAGCPRLESASLARLWAGFDLLATRNSAYGNLAVLQTAGSRTLYENGLVLFTVPDPAAAEESVHFALLEHPAPARVLLIGGGVNGSLEEALRHPSIERIDYVELDPAILDLARSLFHWRAPPRVNVQLADGRLFLKSTLARYDVIVVNLPDPQTAQLNRFYTEEFFREAAARLTPTGILSLRLTSSEDYINPELAAFLRSIHKTLLAVFPDVMAIPGETMHFFAARRPGVLAAGPEDLVRRLRERRLSPTYVSESFLPFRLSPDRVSELDRRIAPRPETPLNRDFHPVAYYFAAALWSTRFGQRYRGVFEVMAGISFGAVAAAAAVLFLAALALPGRGRRRLRTLSGGCMAAVGFVSIGLEILILLAFQARFGSVYGDLAVVIAAFMAGIGLGSWLAQRSADGLRRRLRVLVVLQVAVAVAAFLLLALFQTALGGKILFPAAALASGMMGGAQFPTASRIWFTSSQRRNPGALYALDLAGSCLGATLISAYFVPVFGFWRTAAVMAIVGLSPLGAMRRWIL